MATATIQLPIEAAIPADGTASNAAPAIYPVKGTNANPARMMLVAAFDAATAEYIWYRFRMPVDYASAPVLKIHWYTTSVTAGHSCLWGCSLGAITPADADTPLEHAQATAQTQATDVNTTEANRLIETSITITNTDSVAAGDLVTLAVYRDAANASDDLNVDAILAMVALEYTTT